MYRGITTDPARRRKEHKDSGKRFTSMSVGHKVSKDTALEREKKGINDYKKRKGRRSRYNKKG